jgi:hypothetical protein
MAFFDGTNAPTLTLEIDVGNKGTFTFGVSYLGGTDVLGTSSSPNWSTISISDIRAISIRRGRTREDQSNQPGNLTVTLDNRSGTYDPDNSSSPYYWNLYSTLMAGMDIRLSATYGGTTYVIYRGKIEMIDVDNSLDPTVTFRCVDSLAYFGRVQLSSLGSPAYSGDTSSVRIGRILDTIGFSASARSLTGSRTLQATSYGSSALALMEEATNCEFGRFHIDRQGNAVEIPYENLFSTTNRFTLSDARTADTIEYDTIVTAPGAKYLTNTVTLTAATGTPTATNNLSILRYGTWTKTYSYPLLDSATAAALAQIFADRYALPKTRVERIEFDALGLSSVWANLLQTDLGDRCSVLRTTVDSRSLSFTSCIESLNHDITPNSWRVSLDLSPAS